jgi:four helix bundle protein
MTSPWQSTAQREYCLTNQLRRAAYSVPANIVEGSARDSRKEYLHFLYIARGSLNEARYFLHLSHRLGYLAEESRARLQAQADEVARTLTGLIRAVEKESGLLSRVAAKASSLLVLSIGSVVFGLRSAV